MGVRGEAIQSKNKQIEEGKQCADRIPHLIFISIIIYRLQILQFDEKRIGVALYEYQGNLYAAGGGYNPNSESARVQKYDPITNTWQHMPSLLNARRKAKLYIHFFPKKSI